MSTELTSLQVMRLVHDTEEAAVAPLREVAGESVRWLRPRALSEVCASLLREAGRAVQVEREASSRLRDSLTLSDQREAAAHAALDGAGAPKSALLADRVRDLSVRVDERLGEVRANGDETAQRWLALAHRRGQVLRDVRRALTVGSTDESDSLSRFCVILLTKVERLEEEQGEAIHVTPPLSASVGTALGKVAHARNDSPEALALAVQDLLEVTSGLAKGTPPLPALPWRPASKPPENYLTVPLRNAEGEVLCGYYDVAVRVWVVMDEEGEAGPYEPTYWLPLEALQQAAESRPQPVATPETLGVACGPRLADQFTETARAYVAGCFAPLRGLITGGDAMEDRALVAAVARLLASRGSQIDTAYRLLGEAGVPDSDGQVPRPLASRLRALITERDALRAQLAEQQAAAGRVAQTLTQERDQARDELAGLRSLNRSLTARLDKAVRP